MNGVNVKAGCSTAVIQACMFRLEIESVSRNYSSTKCVVDLLAPAASKSGSMEKESLDVRERNCASVNTYESSCNNKQLSSIWVIQFRKISYALPVGGTNLLTYLECRQCLRSLGGGGQQKITMNGNALKKISGCPELAICLYYVVCTEECGILNTSLFHILESCI